MSDDWISGCGCCGEQVLDDEMWCANCCPHVLSEGAWEDRTYWAQYGRECPFQVGILGVAVSLEER